MAAKMLAVKYLPIFTMTRHYEHRPTLYYGHIGENETKHFSGIIYAYSVTTKWVSIEKYTY